VNRSLSPRDGLGGDDGLMGRDLVRSLSTLVLFSIGCGHAPTAPAANVPAPAPPPMVAVILHGAVIAPTKLDGTAWDVDLSGSPREAVAAVQALMAITDLPSIPAAIGLTFAKPCMVAIARPDPFGEAEVESNGSVSSFQLPIIKDTFTPTWSGIRWSHVPLVSATRFRISLTDKDVAFDDPIGAATLNGEQLLPVLGAGTSVPVRVADQTQAQLLFVWLEVVPEPTAPAALAPPTPPPARAAGSP
jgi:hypothetical protein